eukprot:Platyproteum_vivax@DN7030_c0_g1_i1.p1
MEYQRIEVHPHTWNTHPESAHQLCRKKELYSKQKGREAVVYFQHLYKFYDCLDDWSLLMHGHRGSYHQVDFHHILRSKEFLELVKDATPPHGPGIIYTRNKADMHLNDPSHIQREVREMLVNYRNLFVPEKPLEKLLESDAVLSVTLHNTLIVHKSVVRERPRNYYKKLWEFYMSDENYKWPMDDWTLAWLSELYNCHVFSCDKKNLKPPNLLMQI